MVQTVELNDKTETIRITSEDDAWRLLGAAVKGENMPDRIRLVFDGWPVWGVHIEGKDWNSTVPTRIMTPLLDLQRDLHRSYVSVAYGSENLARLSNSDREDLEIVVKVDKGSSDYKADLYRQLTTLGEKLIDKMSPNELIITILGIGFAWAGTSIVKHWITERRIEKEIEAGVERSRQDTEKIRVFAEAMKRSPVVVMAKDNAESTHNRILKSLKPSDDIEIAGISMSASEAHEIAQDEIERSRDIEIGGIFRILANDTTQPTGFRVKVSRIADGETVNAIVPVELPYEQQKVIRDAEWSRGSKLVELRISAKVLRGKTHSAVINDARAVDH